MTSFVRRTIKVGAAEVTYDARVEQFTIEDRAGQPGARIVCTSYTRSEEAAARDARPVVFAFNGGPGSSSVWLHLGLGPRRVAQADLLSPRATPPYEIVDNHETLLDVADLVFIDPPGTGFSRVLTPEQESDFYSVEGDAQASIRLISAWCRRHRRENSPKLLLGESYGAVRAAAVCRMLPGGPTRTGRLEWVSLSGAVLLGAAASFAPLGDTAHLVELPTQAATAWYHDRLPARPDSLDSHLRRARRFAAEEYGPALFAGTALPAARREEVARTLHELIGIRPEVLIQHRLRLTPAQFSRLLLAETGGQVGMYDSRYALPLGQADQDPVGDDPAMSQYVGMFSGALVPYLRDELGANYEEEYRFIEFARVNGRWNYGSGPGALPSSASILPDFAVAMCRDPEFQVLVCQGYYDQVTSVGALDHALTREPVDGTRFQVRQYESGHMPYLGQESRALLADDIRRFIAETTFHAAQEHRSG